MSQKLNDLVIAIDDFMTYGRSYDEHQICDDLVIIIQLVSHEKLTIELHYGTDQLIQKITREYKFSELVGMEKIAAVFHTFLADLHETYEHTEKAIGQMALAFVREKFMKCPNCEVVFDINNSQSTHQVNDNNEETYCSYECSAVGTLRYLQELAENNPNDSLDHVQLVEIIQNT